MANQVYDTLKEGLLSGDITLSADDVYVLLVQESNVTVTTSATVLSGTISLEYSGTSATELTETSGVNYTSGGFELTGKVVSAGTTAGTVIFDANDITISATPTEDTTITAGGMLLYKRIGVSIDTSVDIPLAYFDYGVDQVTANAPYKIQWHSTGIITLETKVV